MQAPKFALVAALVLIVGSLGWRALHPRSTDAAALEPNSPAVLRTVHGEAAAVPRDPATTAGLPRVVLNPAVVLATINGRGLRLGDLTPLDPTNPTLEVTLSPETFQYLLERAVDRELILQEAQAQGVDLSEAQRQHLATLRAQREQPEPGLVRRLDSNPARTEFELREAKAFLLQANLLAQAGATPHITPAQVRAYYQQHAATFEPLPEDPAARDAVWARIDYQIRQLHAPSAQQHYGQQSQEFLRQLRGRADLVLPPPPLVPDAHPSGPNAGRDEGA